MINLSELKVSQRLRETFVSDEYFFRQLAQGIVKEMSFEDLKKLIKFSKIDPNSEHSKKQLTDMNCPTWKKEKILKLSQENVILYTAKCEL